MSDWVARRRQEAFALYRSYTAMQLHFKGSTGFDYAQYGGKVRASYENFVAKVELLNRFTKMSLAVNGPHNPELFVFANARYGLDIGYGDFRKNVKVFEKWFAKYGTKAELVKNGALTIRSYYFIRGNNKPIDIAMALLESDDEDATEALISYLHFYPPLVLEMNEMTNGNAIWELRWNKVNKIRTLYYHFGIL